MRRVLVTSILGLISLMVYSQTEIPRAQAMFIYNFSRLIEWPSEYKSGPYVIAVYGSCQTLSELESFTAGKNVGSQPIAVKKTDASEEIPNCHILFVPFNKTKELPIIVPKLQNKSTLIISEKNGAIDNGSAINFVVIGDKLKFEIKPGNILKYNMKVSSKLNEMAYKVY
jgi:hypothetical protein